MNVRHSHRIFVSNNLVQDSVVTPNPDQTHHLINVLRLKSDDVVRLFNGHHGEFRGEIAMTGKKTIDIRVHECLRPHHPEPDLWLCAAPIKKAHFDFMLEKATELGVSEIQLILTRRTQIRDVNGDRAWTICREAAEQSERLSVPAVGNPVSLDDLIAVFPTDRTLIVCAEHGEATPIHHALLNVKNTSKAAILTGPEGGFATEELDKLRPLPNALFVRLGPRILRADTAAIAALTCWQAVHGDWNSNA